VTVNKIKILSRTFRCISGGKARRIWENNRCCDWKWKSKGTYSLSPQFRRFPPWWKEWLGSKTWINRKINNFCQLSFQEERFIYHCKYAYKLFWLNRFVKQSIITTFKEWQIIMFRSIMESQRTNSRNFHSSLISEGQAYKHSTEIESLWPVGQHLIQSSSTSVLYLVVTHNSLLDFGVPLGNIRKSAYVIFNDLKSV
jgi:hypothetical protein